MCNSGIHVPYVAVKNNKVMLKIVNSLQVPAQVYWAKCSHN